MVICAELALHLHGLRLMDSASLAEVAAHIRMCARCRRGQIALPAGFALPKSLRLDHHTQQPRLASYYEATHPEYPLEQLADQAILAIALHLILAHEGGTYCCTSSLRDKPAFVANSDSN